MSTPPVATDDVVSTAGQEAIDSVVATSGPTATGGAVPTEPSRRRTNIDVQVFFRKCLKRIVKRIEFKNLCNRILARYDEAPFAVASGIIAECIRREMTKSMAQFTRDAVTGRRIPAAGQVAMGDGAAAEPMATDDGFIAAGPSRRTITEVQAYFSSHLKQFSEREVFKTECKRIIDRDVAPFAVAMGEIAELIQIEMTRDMARFTLDDGQVE